ncbi:gamma-glutamyl-gamma-aminobutyrate hydrolase family protein [Rhodococcus sp. NPDC003318]|uniref:gamma-glutamyl-gamma-aminobutyrate hydrolase family protein n=1 Tax=Rhodococcus sp. NPDC003318 TaxID=3364503 RepID=UPI003698D259
MRTLGVGLVATGHAPDGVIEAFEAPGRFVVGVQWHPEAPGTAPQVAAAPFTLLHNEIEIGAPAAAQLP